MLDRIRAKAYKGQDRMLTELVQVLNEEGYKKATKKTYKWQAAEYFKWCTLNNVQPQKPQEKDLKKYFQTVWEKDKSKNKTLFTQAFSIVEIFLLTSDNLKAALLLPKIRKEIRAA